MSVNYNIFQILNEKSEVIVDEENRILYSMEINGAEHLVYKSLAELQDFFEKPVEGTETLQDECKLSCVEHIEQSTSPGEGPSAGSAEFLKESEATGTETLIQEHIGQSISSPGEGPSTGSAKCLKESKATDSRKSGHWNDKSIDALLDAYEALEKLSKNADVLGPIFWRKVIGFLANNFIQKTWIECREKWKSMDRTYKQCLKKLNSTGKGPITWPFFERMHEIMKNKPQVQPVAIPSSIAGYKKRISEEIDVPKPKEDNSNEKQAVKKSKIKRSTEEPEWMKEARAETAMRHAENKEAKQTMIELFQDLLQIQRKRYGQNK